jgi:hypothetical protein
MLFVYLAWAVIALVILNVVLETWTEEAARNLYNELSYEETPVGVLERKLAWSRWKMGVALSRLKRERLVNFGGHDGRLTVALRMPRGAE